VDRDGTREESAEVTNRLRECGFGCELEDLHAGLDFKNDRTERN